MALPTATRDHLLRALRADLVGPFAPEAAGEDSAEEVLPLPPSRWYLTGFLAPEEGRGGDSPADSPDPEANDTTGAGMTKTTKNHKGRSRSQSERTFSPHP